MGDDLGATGGADLACGAGETGGLRPFRCTGERCAEGGSGALLDLRGDGVDFQWVRVV